MRTAVGLGRGKAASQSEQVGQCNAVKLVFPKQHFDRWFDLAAPPMDREIVLVVDGNRTSEANEEFAFDDEALVRRLAAPLLLVGVVVLVELAPSTALVRRLVTTFRLRHFHFRDFKNADWKIVADLYV